MYKFVEIIIIVLPPGLSTRSITTTPIVLHCGVQIYTVSSRHNLGMMFIPIN